MRRMGYDHVSLELKLGHSQVTSLTDASVLLATATRSEPLGEPAPIVQLVTNK